MEHTLLNISIRVKELTRHMGKNLALDDLSIEFSEGRIHGLIGPDGAGKTTLIRMIAGLLSREKGDILYLSEGEERPFEEIRAHLAYMPSRSSLYPDLSIEEHLQFFKSLFSLKEKEYQAYSRELLSITRLEKFRDRKVGELSGGMYKKVGLMCSLLRRPKILLLDEPTNGVDPISRREFWELLYALLQEHILILVSTAYMDEAERCSSVHLLDRGKLLKTGEPQSVLKEAGVSSFDEIFLEEVSHE